jgi:hypothetical protein
VWRMGGEVFALRELRKFLETWGGWQFDGFSLIFHGFLWLVFELADCSFCWVARNFSNFHLSLSKHSVTHSRSSNVFPFHKHKFSQTKASHRDNGLESSQKGCKEIENCPLHSPWIAKQKGSRHKVVKEQVKFRGKKRFRKWSSVVCRKTIQFNGDFFPFVSFLLNYCERALAAWNSFRHQLCHFTDSLTSDIAFLCHSFCFVAAKINFRNWNINFDCINCDIFVRTSLKLGRRRSFCAFLVALGCVYSTEKLL